MFSHNQEMGLTWGTWGKCLWLIEHRKYHNLLLPSTTLKMIPKTAKPCFLLHM